MSKWHLVASTILVAGYMTAYSGVTAACEPTSEKSTLMKYLEADVKHYGDDDSSKQELGPPNTIYIHETCGSELVQKESTTTHRIVSYRTTAYTNHSELCPKMEYYFNFARSYGGTGGEFECKCTANQSSQHSRLKHMCVSTYGSRKEE